MIAPIMIITANDDLMHDDDDNISILGITQKSSHNKIIDNPWLIIIIIMNTLIA